MADKRPAFKPSLPYPVYSCAIGDDSFFEEDGNFSYFLELYNLH